MAFGRARVHECHDADLSQESEGSITILGEKGTVRVGGVAVNEIQHWTFDEPLPEDEKVREASYATTSVYGFGHPLYYENVIDVLRGARSPIPTAARG
ncbi:MAG: Gfo/Idh/MocA family oxidoreductase [Burkholderiaceae bacterium]